VTADPAGKRTGAPRDGCWAAYRKSDGQIVALFSNEIDALRYAVDNGLKTQRVRYGVDLRDQITAGAS
jgi:hypothetical protein